MRKSVPVIAAFTLAIGAHLALAVAIALPESEGAKAEGTQGIEIDLGMLGDLGTDEVQKQAKAEPAPEPPPPEPEPESVVEPEPVAEPVQKPALEVRKKEPEPKPTPKPEPEPKPEPKPAPEPEPVARDDAQAQAQDEVTRQRASTGQANARSNGGSVGATQSYYAKLAAKLAAHKDYPRRARRRGHEGVVTLAFVVSREGRVLESEIVQSSGYTSLDRAVIRMLERAQPLPAFSSSMQGDRLRIELPVEFSLKNG